MLFLQAWEGHRESLMKIETTASGKAFLSGEYMALEGGRAITLSTPQSAKVSISEKNESNNLFLSSMSDQAYPFRIDENMNLIWLDEDPKHLGSILKESIKQFEKSFSGRSISIDTSDFFYYQKKMGIGSSSAVSVAITKALNRLFDLRLTSQAIINHAREIHNRAQDSRGSGFDIITSFLEGRSFTCRFLDGTYDYQHIELPEAIKIFVVINDEYSETSAMIDRYNNAKSENRDYFSKHALNMKEELEHLYASILNKDSESILQKLRGYNELLVDMDNVFNLGIFNNHHELIKLSKDEDVFYKPSGSGGGDIGLLISNDESKLEKVCKKIESDGIHIFEI
jgi:phosphomevalonate kinase